MSAFAYRDGQFRVEETSLTELAERIGTPFYCYSEAILTANWRAWRDAFAGDDALICYALKANGNIAIVRAFAELGGGADIVSAGELEWALAAGVPPDRIVFSGVGKTRTELERALATGILQVNVESLQELEVLSAVAADAGSEIEVAIRVNPGVDAETHDKISTGRRGDKFGIDLANAGDIFRHAASLPGIRPVSVAMHIGSQLTSLTPFRRAFETLAGLVGELREAGCDIRRVDVGGGLGITYGSETPPAVSDYAALVRETIGSLGCRILLEPGRALVGNAGILVSRVVYTKEEGGHRFVILDAAMNDLVRPALYDAWHDIRPVVEPAADAPQNPVDIVGPICESGDTFAQERPMPPLAPGDLVIIDNAGAYGAVMASSYNARPVAPEVLVRGADVAIIRRRRDFAEMMEPESLASWQSTPAVPESR